MSSPSAMSYVRDNAIFANMDIEPVGVEVPSHHHARLDDSCRLRKVGFAKGLRKSGQSASSTNVLPNKLTVSVEGPSQSTLPASLFIHSCVLSLPRLSAVTPGTTRGILEGVLSVWAVCVMYL